MTATTAPTGEPRAYGRRDRKPRTVAIVRGALVFLIPFVILAAAAIRGLPDQHHDAVPDWRPGDATAAH